MQPVRITPLAQPERPIQRISDQVEVYIDTNDTARARRPGEDTSDSVGPTCYETTGLCLAPLTPIEGLVTTHSMPCVPFAIQRELATL